MSKEQSSGLPDSSIVKKPVEKSDLHILFVDDQGVGRCNIAKAFAKKMGFENADSAGVRAPDSGRTDLHQSVIEIIHLRTKIDASDWEVQLLAQEMVTTATIVVFVGISEELPDYVFETAFAVINAELADPFHDLENKLQNITTKLALIVITVLGAVARDHTQIPVHTKVGTLDRRGINELVPYYADPNYRLEQSVTIQSRV